MIFIFWFVFFIICDEKWIKIKWEENHIVFHETRDISESIATWNTTKDGSWTMKKIVYKNSDIIRIYPGFENPRKLRESNGLDLEYLAKIEEKFLEQEKKSTQEKFYTWPNMIALNDETISSVFNKNEIIDNKTENDEIVIDNVKNNENKGNDWWLFVGNETWTIQNQVNKIITWEEQDKINTERQKEEAKEEVQKEVQNEDIPSIRIEAEKLDNSWNEEIWWFIITERDVSSDFKLKEYEYSNKSLNLYKWIKKDGISRESVQIENDKEDVDNNEIKSMNTVIIKLYPWFANPKNLRFSAGVDENFLAMQKNNNETTIALLTGEYEDKELIEEESSTFTKIEKPNLSQNSVELSKGKELIYDKSEDLQIKGDYQIDYEVIKDEELIEEESTTFTKIEKPELSQNSVELSRWKESVMHTTKVERYNPVKHYISLKKWVEIKQSFVVENNNLEEILSNWLSDSTIEWLLENEEINLDVLESENDEFLQKVFDTTRDVSVMNLIVENYLNEYQFVKAKKFIENLPEIYRDELKPLLNLRVSFNSFALTSKTISQSLASLVQNYISTNEISNEDKNRYLWVIALMDRNYDKFFEISAWFTSEKNKSFASKLQWYKDQISKQMWMPEYYFDTLVSLELFNQWLFQPAKVLALYSLQQNSNYILPYQILAYANFLTNSRDTSIEYLRKLMDIDPNNAEKYRFLMWIAYYWDEKYQQSVIMLSLIKDNKLRLDAERYLVLNYVILDQKSKLITIWNKLLWYDDLVASDFYTYFYEVFFRPFAEGKQYQLYASDTELANKMIRVCSMKLSDEEKVVCNYWMIGKNIAQWEFSWLEESLLNLTAQYPQWYLYQALWEYYIKQWDLEKAKAYLLKAVSMTKRTSEIDQIKKLLQETM